MINFQVNPDLTYIIPPEKHSLQDITAILEQHQEIKFVSLSGIDLAGNDTDEKIPISDFIKNIDDFLLHLLVELIWKSIDFHCHLKDFFEILSNRWKRVRNYTK